MHPWSFMSMCQRTAKCSNFGLPSSQTNNVASSVITQRWPPLNNFQFSAIYLYRKCFLHNYRATPHFSDYEILEILILYLGKYIVLTVSLLIWRHSVQVKCCVMNVKLVLYIPYNLRRNHTMDTFSELGVSLNYVAVR